MTARRPEPSHFLHGARGARVLVVPQEFASWLHGTGALRDLRRLRQATDPLIDAVLTALALAALEATSDVGSKPAPTPEVRTRSTKTLTSRAVADQLNITTRAVTDACKAGRLTAQQNREGRWLINADSVDNLRTAS